MSQRPFLFNSSHHSLLIFVYDKEDDTTQQAGHLNSLHTAFVENYHTADYQITSGLHKILDNNGNIDDIFAFLSDRYLPVDEAQAIQLAEEILNNRPQLGYLTIFPFHALRGIHNMTLHADWMLSSTGENP